MKDLLIQYLEGKGNTNVELIGAFFQWKSKTGESGYASFNAVCEEWKRGR